MERCPNCRARLVGRETCRRCGMDLVLLLSVERAAEDLIAGAVGCLLVEDLGKAREHLERSLSLRRDPLAEHLLGFIEGLARNGRADARTPVAPADRLVGCH